jgi:hypothetical protein
MKQAIDNNEDKSLIDSLKADERESLWINIGF